MRQLQADVRAGPRPRLCSQPFAANTSAWRPTDLRL